MWKKIELDLMVQGIPHQIKKKNKFSKPSRSRSFRSRVTEGEGEGEGDVDGHSICLKDADKSDSRSVSGFT